MTAFVIGFAVGGFFGAVAVILWALCAAAQKSGEEKGDALPPTGGGARMPEKRPTRPPKE